MAENASEELNTRKELEANEGGILRSTHAFIRMSLSSDKLEVPGDDVLYSPTTLQELRVLLPLVEAGDFKGLQTRLNDYTSKKSLITRLLNGALPGRNGQTLLHLAAAQGSKQIVQLLLEHGANPAVRDNNGRRGDEWFDGLSRSVHRLLLWYVSKHVHEHTISMSIARKVLFPRGKFSFRTNPPCTHTHTHMHTVVPSLFTSARNSTQMAW